MLTERELVEVWARWCQAEPKPQRLPWPVRRAVLPAGARDPRQEDPQPSRQRVRQGAPVLQRLCDARRAAGRTVLGGIRIAGRRRGLQEEPRRDPEAGLPRQGRPGDQADQEPQRAPGANPRTAPARTGRLSEGKQPEFSFLVGPKGGYLTTATVRDATNWDSIVAGLLTARPHPTRPAPHRSDMHGRRRYPAARAPRHPWAPSIETTRGYLDPDDRHLASAAEQADAFLSAAGQRKQSRRSGPSARGMGCGAVPVLVAAQEFWSRYPQGSRSSRSDCPRATFRRHPRGPRGGPIENDLRT